jgi:ferredoxin
MAYKVKDTCVNCGSCDSECSVSAISEKDGKRFIDPAVCVSCGACASACPTESIVEE